MNNKGMRKSADSCFKELEISPLPDPPFWINLVRLWNLYSKTMFPQNFGRIKKNFQTKSEFSFFLSRFFEWWWRFLAVRVSARLSWVTFSPSFTQYILYLTRVDALQQTERKERKKEGNWKARNYSKYIAYHQMVPSCHFRSRVSGLPCGLNGVLYRQRYVHY